ncbi:translation initiation factor IF-3 [bacterium BMS3Abin05]|nr:translation initiation factor IF-3 [bacterium BMS3Abin05]GBE27348.1 translation initiation factor IF-3 [bacterium BMS3Bbin03]
MIDENGEQMGVISLEKALKLAEEKELDLVEVAPTARPPVCKILNYGKFRYEKSKRDKDQKKKQHVIIVKEVRLRPKIGEHDFLYKMKHAREFLEAGNRLKVTVMFRGREMVYKEFGYKIINRVVEELSDISKVEKGPVSEGRHIVLFLTRK